MRYVNPATVICPDGWEIRADAARNDVSVNGTDIEDHGDIWRDYKAPLKAASSNKCWYCELSQKRSDNAVDHFRPKDHYRWSAFSAENFRFSCTYCNCRRKNPETGKTGGKGNSFPLLDEALKATCAAEEDRETPLLLDPCVPTDPGLLSFRADGTPCPRYEKHPIRSRRAFVSIELYHLDHPDAVEVRRTRALWIDAKVKAADRIYKRCDEGDPDLDASFNAIVKDLADALSDRAELSAFTRCMLSGHRDKEWVEPLLDTA
jgi:uncharacterized protein (TIGR02646 family)